MRDVMIGAGGAVVGGMLGVAAVIVVELAVVGAVAGTLALVPRGAESPVAVGRAPRGDVAPSAAPGELQILTMAAVQASADGVPMGFDPAQGYLATLAPGRHRLQITGAFGSVLSDTEVDVASGERTQLRWAKGALTDQGRMPMAGASATARVPSAPVRTAASLTVDTEAHAVTVDAAEVVEDLVEGGFSSGSAPRVEIRLPKISIGRK